MADIQVKICGVSQPRDIAAASRAGASYVGFAFFEKSPRNLSLEAARDLAAGVPATVRTVALCVNPEDAALDALIAAVPVDMLQLHGGEPPSRVASIRARYGVPVMKAVGVRDANDLMALESYAEVSDQLLVDAKPPKDAALPGGNGLSFDWRLIADRQWPVPWMLAGGLTAQNVGEAIRLTGAQQVDVSSGVESAPGVKDSALIEGFIAAARA